MYVAVKGGEKAILNTHRLVAEERRGDPDVPEISVAQIKNQMSYAVDRVMNEGSLYDPDLAALAIKQAGGDLVEAVFLLRAFRTTLPRFFKSQPMDTSKMNIRRRISAIFKDLPGGQILGPTYDYTHRLLDFELMDECEPALPMEEEEEATVEENMPRAMEILDHEGIIEKATTDDGDPDGYDITREPMVFPASRSQRLQNLARGDEGFLTALGYSTQRSYGNTHPFVGELRVGEVSLEIVPEELGFEIEIGEMTITECEMVNQFKGSDTEPPQFTRGYGLVFGYSERKAMAMALVDRALRSSELGEEAKYPAQDEQFTLGHSDNVEASGMIQHLKLPHYVDFQSERQLVRGLRTKFFSDNERAAEDE